MAGDSISLGAIGCGSRGDGMLRTVISRWGILASLCLTLTMSLPTASAQAPVISIRKAKQRLEITVGDRQFATYIYRDPAIKRPCFANVFSPNGTRVTRHHPPRPGVDSTDHATMHPGIGLAFGDISGSDFWRNKGRVEHAGFVGALRSEAGTASFVVRNRYIAGDRLVCTEVCRHELRLRPGGVLLTWDSSFRSGEGNFFFGDQEEMGLGVRVARELRVRGGTGRITNSEGRVNEKAAWGRQADWCDYSGIVGKTRAGILLMPAPGNFRRSWFHARDYGFLAANPFGRKAFTRGVTSRVVVQRGKTFRLRYGVLVYGGKIDRAAAFKDYCRLVAIPRP